MSESERVRLAAAAAQPAEAAAPGGHPMEIWISYVLRVGVLTAAAIVFVGLVLFLVRGTGASGPQSLDDILGNGGHTVAVTPGEIFHNVMHGDAIAIIQLGVLVLILTPTMRVAMTTFLFLAQRDWIFVAITCVVFIVLIIGLIGIGA
jgi:uncharacterized membrane protein